MIDSSSLNIKIWLFNLVVLALLFLLKHYWPKLAGKSGENFVKKKLLKLDPQYYKVLNDLLLPSSGNTTTTQIDHVVVSNYGVFCIETKNYEGSIYGSERQEYWAQYISGYKNNFYNPLRQNFVHIKALEALIKPIYPNVSVIAFVAFLRADKIKVSGTNCVGYAKDAVRKIKEYSTQILTDGENC